MHVSAHSSRMKWMSMFVTNKWKLYITQKLIHKTSLLFIYIWTKQSRHHCALPELGFFNGYLPPVLDHVIKGIATAYWVSTYNETESSSWLLWTSLETLKASFNVLGPVTTRVVFLTTFPFLWRYNLSLAKIRQRPSYKKLPECLPRLLLGPHQYESMVYHYTISHLGETILNDSLIPSWISSFDEATSFLSPMV